jgi:hypothetical protein
MGYVDLDVTDANRKESFGTEIEFLADCAQLLIQSFLSWVQQRRFRSTGSTAPSEAQHPSQRY